MSCRYRIAENEYNLRTAPWSEAIGIERVSYREDGAELYAVPPVVCWLTRGSDQLRLAEIMVERLNG